MMELEDACRGQISGIAALAMLYVPGARMCHELYEALRNERLGFPEVTDVDAWLSCYRRPGDWLGRLGSWLMEEELPPDDARMLVRMGLAGVREVNAMSRVELIQSVQANPEVLALAREFWTALADDALQLAREAAGLCEPDDDEPQPTPSIDVIFFVRICLPCVLLHGVWPVTLYRKARNGDLEALEKLLRLDAMFLRERTVANVMAKRQECIDTRKLVGRAISSELPELTPAKVKLRLAAMIWKCSSEVLNTPEIREFFDAFARDESHGRHLVDEDLPPSPEAFYKGVSRDKGKLHLG